MGSAAHGVGRDHSNRIDEIQVGKDTPISRWCIKSMKGTATAVGGRKEESENAAALLPLVGEARTARLQFICSDMWKPYLKVVQKKAGQAIHILDRFHIVAHLNKAIDEVRAQEARDLKKQGKGEILKRALAVSETGTEPESEAGRETGGDPQAQSADGAELSTERGIPVVLGVQVGMVGRTVSG
jgi:hypothetical protein